jgi:hypothetical protein
MSYVHFTFCKATCINIPNILGNFKLLMWHLILFQTYIEIFNKIEDVNLAAIVVSSITIVALLINNEILKVSTKGTSLPLSLCHCMHVCVHWPVCVLYSEAYTCACTSERERERERERECVCVRAPVSVRACVCVMTTELHSTHMMWKHNLPIFKEASHPCTVEEESITTWSKLLEFKLKKKFLCSVCEHILLLMTKKVQCY